MQSLGSIPSLIVYKIRNVGLLRHHKHSQKCYNLVENLSVFIRFELKYNEIEHLASQKREKEKQLWQLYT